MILPATRSLFLLVLDPFLFFYFGTSPSSINSDVSQKKGLVAVAMMPREAGMAAVNDQRDRFTFPATRTCPLGPIFSTKPVARRHSRPRPLHPDGFSLGDSKYLYWRRIRSGVAMTGCHKISHQLTFSHQSLPRQLTCPQMSFRISTPIIDASTFLREDLLLHVTRRNFDISKYTSLSLQEVCLSRCDPLRGSENVLRHT